MHRIPPLLDRAVPRRREEAAGGTIDLRTLGTELAALATAVLSVPLRLVVPPAVLDPDARHRTPVVFVHGLFGDATNLLVLRRFLAARGVRNVTSFSYLPRLDHQRLAPRLGRAIAATCRAARSPQVDVGAHSPGGLVARYLIETGDGGLVRRLVTLGAPYYTARILPQELAIFAAQDPLVAAPHPTYGPRGRVVVVPRCGHFGLLYHPAVLDEVARFLSAARDERAPAVAA